MISRVEGTTTVPTYIWHFVNNFVNNFVNIFVNIFQLREDRTTFDALGSSSLGAALFFAPGIPSADVCRGRGTVARPLEVVWRSG